MWHTNWSTNDAKITDLDHIYEQIGIPKLNYWQLWV